MRIGAGAKCGGGVAGRSCGGGEVSADVWQGLAVALAVTAVLLPGVPLSQKLLFCSQARCPAPHFGGTLCVVQQLLSVGGRRLVWY